MIRSDKKESLLKVADIVINDPTLSQRDIAEMTGLGLGTVNRAINDLEQVGTKSQDIMKVCETDFEIVQLGQKIINERLKNKTETDKMRTFEIAQTIEKSEKRYMLFKGKATDENGGLNIDFSETQTGLLLARMNEIYGKRNDGTN